MICQSKCLILIELACLYKIFNVSHHVQNSKTGTCFHKHCTNPLHLDFVILLNSKVCYNPRQIMGRGVAEEGGGLIDITIDNSF